MPEFDNYRLCGGTFFTLLLMGRKDRTDARGHLKGMGDGLSDSEVLIGLASIINSNPDAGFHHIVDSFQSTTSAYKACKNNGGNYLPFKDDQAIIAFDERVKNHYFEALTQMASFVDSFLEYKTSTKKDVNLVAECLKLLDADKLIEDHHVFYASPNGSTLTKAELLNGTSPICFQSFLLGVFHYAIVKRRDNTIGKLTYEVLCPPARTSGSIRTYSYPFGHGHPKTINLMYFDSPSKTEALDDEQVEPDEESSTTSSPNPTLQIDEDDNPPGKERNKPEINQMMFIQNGNNNVQIGYIENYDGRKSKL
ncbi:MAG: hypothetical protein PHI01_05970 [Candidatus Izemoplasmatales bacterium]|nr:hypothetical protein [Candidatus Cloacimonadota bacterium]MDD4184941.1 hypothetical protein [Candidatus Izemoplasmatales bacterium]